MGEWVNDIINHSGTRLLLYEIWRLAEVFRFKRPTSGFLEVKTGWVRLFIISPHLRRRFGTGIGNVCSLNKIGVAKGNMNIELAYFFLKKVLTIFSVIVISVASLKLYQRLFLVLTQNRDAF